MFIVQLLQRKQCFNMFQVLRRKLMFTVKSQHWFTVQLQNRKPMFTVQLQNLVTVL